MGKRNLSKDRTELNNGEIVHTKNGVSVVFDCLTEKVIERKIEPGEIVNILNRNTDFKNQDIS